MLSVVTTTIGVPCIGSAVFSDEGAGEVSLLMLALSGSANVLPVALHPDTLIRSTAAAARATRRPAATLNQVDGYDLWEEAEVESEVLSEAMMYFFREGGGG
ncbi:hypothetical protein APU90_03405 [Rathayibacter toxicus]|uniref:Uncharacterized protein n=1 Tax=Rathayibacter toxicus TaxID=145458 RepID=A0A0C5BG74_9MICO|nr:hypothetical protein TI83_03065 [Rathayibacter toxicus]ALS56931.1 hypothetical protein APU90_03405 [Rathayibacter toxicus]KKM46235.1 hypothetical protein VT73_04090 [Rathayibacter toxicus]